MNGAVIYVRVSSDDQIRRNSANLPTQIRKCQDFCDHEKLEVLKQFNDEGESGRTTDRPAFQKMMQFCRDPKNKGITVVVSDLSRLARNIEDQAATMTELARLNIKLTGSGGVEHGTCWVALTNIIRTASASALRIVWTRL